MENSSNKTARLGKFLLTNFGPLLAFYVANHFYGIRAAVFASVAWTIGEIIACRIGKRKISTFFIFTAAVTIVFGVIDMYLQRSLFFKYEPAVTNILTGIYFAATLFAEKPLIQEFAEAQGRAREPTPDRNFFFRFMTAVWAAYFFVKAAFYGWIAQNYSLEEGLAIRGVVGTASFYALLFLSIFCAKYIIAVLGKARLLPSTARKN